MTSHPPARPRRLPSGLIALVLLIGPVAGCGGDEEDDLGDPSAPSSSVSASDETEAGGEGRTPLPASFVAVPPEDSTVRNVNERGLDVSVTFGVSGDQARAGAAYRDLLKQAGFRISKKQKTTSNTGGDGLAFRAETDTFAMRVTTRPDPSEPGQAIIGCSYTIGSA